jgi:hypothetical protein
MAIKAAHDLKCWRALLHAYQIRSVDICVQEATQTDKDGRQLVVRTKEEVAAEITVGLVTDEMRTALEFEIGLRADVHRGERDLLAYALTLPEAWWLCGPDNGTVRAMKVLRILNRMVSLESIATSSGHRGPMPSKHYTERWLSDHRTQALLDEAAPA